MRWAVLIIGLDPGDQVEHLLYVSAVEDGNVLQQREEGHVGHRPRGVASGVENVDGEIAPGKRVLEIVHRRLHGGDRRSYLLSGLVYHVGPRDIGLHGVSVAGEREAVCVHLS